MKLSALQDRLLFGSLLLLSLALPWSLAGMQIALGIVLAVTLAVALVNRSLPPLRHPFFLALGLYLAVRFISALLSPQIPSSLISIVQNDWVALSLPMLATALLWTRRVETVVQILLVSAALAGLYGCYQFFAGIELYRNKELAPMGAYYRAVGGYGFYLTFAANQLLSFALALSFFLGEKRWQVRKVLYGLAALIIFFSIIATFARSVWLALILVVGLGTLLIKRRLFLYAASATALVILTAALMSPEIQARLLSVFDPSQNQGRLNLWRTSWKMIVDHPLWGIGPGRFNQLFEAYKVPGFYDAKGHAHNDFINMAVNSGIFGLLAWLGMWVTFYYHALKTYRRKNLGLLDRQVLLGSMLGLAGILVASLFQCYFTDLENNLFWWFAVMLGLAVVLRNNSDS